MNKKDYIIPAIDIEHVELTPLMGNSITTIGGNSGLEPGQGDAPSNADSRFAEDLWEE